MDEFAKLIFFLVILGVAAMIKRASEKNQEQERGKQPPRATRAEELPEATRRMIYGTSDVPMAHPARRVVVDEDEDGVNGEGIERPVPRRPEKPDVLVLLQQMAQQAQRGETVTRTPSPVARPAPPRRVEQPPMRRVSMEPERPAPPVRPAPAPRQQAKPRTAPPQPKPAPAPAQTVRAAEPKRERRQARPLQVFLRDLDDVRRGIVLAEILGTPKGLQ